MWKATVLTLFPEMFPGTLGHSLAGKALDAGMWSLNKVNIRDFSSDKNGKVDDVPFGGGYGMVIKADVLNEALKSVSDAPGPRIYLSPRGVKNLINNSQKNYLLEMVQSLYVEGMKELMKGFWFITKLKR